MAHLQLHGSEPWYQSDGKLVVAISSRALFDFEEENRVFEDNDDTAYMSLQRLTPGRARQTRRRFHGTQVAGVQHPTAQQVEVVILRATTPSAACG